MKYHIYVVGCAMNNSDAERISSALQLIGYKKAEIESEANLLIAVACSVRQTAIDRIYSQGHKWRKRKNVVTALTGCVLDHDKKKIKDRFDYIFDINELGDFLRRVSSQNTKNVNIDEYLSVHPVYNSSFQAYIPIMTGCNNFCSYCAVPYVRGREKSRPPKEILAEIKDLIAHGYKEITLLGQNVNSYGESNKKQVTKNKFVELIEKIDQIDGDYRVYFYSNHPKDMSDELITTLPKLKHFPNYIHLPIQSGNDEILRKMNRHYTKKSYLETADKIKKAMPEAAITTDIIVGFPGETKEQFEDTKDVMEKVNFDMAFTAQYSPRPQTASSKLEDNVSKDEKKRREFELQKVVQAKSSLNHNKKLVGKNVRALIDSQKEDKYFGRTDLYKVVEIKTDQSIKIGQFYDIEIVEAKEWKLIGKL